MKQYIFIAITIYITACSQNSSAKKNRSTEENKYIRYTTYKEVPTGMKLYIDSVFGNFSIADTGEVWECCCTRIPELKLPEKLFVEAWQSEDSFKLKYLTGGIATFEHCLLIKMRNGLPQYIISDQNIISSSFKE